MTPFNQLANWGLRPHLSRQADLTSDIKIGAHALECRVRACVLLQPGQLGLDLNEALTRFFFVVIHQIRHLGVMAAYSISN